VSYEARLQTLRAAAVKLVHSYGVPLGLFLLSGLAALYIFTGQSSVSSSDFPRSASDFMQAAKAERRLADLTARLAASPDDMQALAEAGRLKYQLGPARYLEAIADLERARALGLADYRSFFYLGVMYQAEGLYGFASQEYRRFLNNKPDDQEARMLLAKLCYSSGDFPCAVREYEILLKVRAGDAVLLENYALARWKNKEDYAAALAGLRAAGAEGAFLADYAEGRIGYELKDYAKASAFLGKAAAAAASVGGFTDHAGLLWLAADAAQKNKETDPACAYLQELLKLDPAHEEGKRLLAKLEKARKAVKKKK